MLEQSGQIIVTLKSVEANDVFRWAIMIDFEGQIYVWTYDSLSLFADFDVKYIRS